jgi:hypothetical protein
MLQENIPAPPREGGSPAPGDRDLPTLAAFATLRNGGRVFVPPDGRIPRGAPAAAALRH